MRIRKSPQFYLRLSLAFSLLLAGCGGGGGDASTDNRNSDVTPSSLSEVEVSFDLAVPAAAISSVSTISSAFGSAVVGATVPVEQGNLVMALDQEDNLIMAGFFSGGDGVELSAGSTALALVRLAMIPPDEWSVDEVIARVAAAEGFPTLVAAVEAAFNRGESPPSSEQILTMVLQVVREVMSDVGVQSAANVVSRSAVVKAAALPLDNAAEPYPFSIISEAGTFGSVTIDQVKRVENTTAIAWTVRSNSYTGAEIGQASTLPAPSGVLSRNFSPPYLIAEDDGASFSLLVEQNRETKTENLQGILVDLLNALLPIRGQCVTTLAAIAVSAQDLGELVLEPNLHGFLAYLETRGIAALGEAGSDAAVREHCGGAAAGTAFIKGGLKYLVGFFKIADTSLTVLSIAEKASALGLFWNESRDVTICLGVSKQVVNCAYDFQFLPPGFVMVAGDRYQGRIRAVDGNGDETPLPASLEVSAELGVVASDDGTLLAGWVPSRNEVVMRDLATEIVQTEFVEIVDPVFATTTTSVGVGRTGTVALEDPRGRAIQVFGEPLFEFVSSDPDSVEVVQTNGLGASVHGIGAPGAYVVARNIITGREESIYVDVTPGNLVIVPENAAVFSYYSYSSIVPYLAIGDTNHLTVSLTTESGAYEAVGLEWKSSNPSVAVIDSATGLLTGIAAGTTDISAVDPVTEQVSDTVTFTVLADTIQGGLAWKLTSVSAGWLTANDYCAERSWRLPTISELSSLYASKAENWPVSLLWSSTVSETHPDTHHYSHSMALYGSQLKGTSNNSASTVRS